VSPRCVVVFLLNAQQSSPPGTSKPDASPLINPGQAAFALVFVLLAATATSIVGFLLTRRRYRAEIAEKDAVIGDLKAKQGPEIRKLESDSRKADSDALKSQAEALDKMFDSLNKLSTAERELQKRESELVERERAIDAEWDRLRAAQEAFEADRTAWLAAQDELSHKRAQRQSPDPEAEEE
jgi:hypothetical protein